MKDRRIASLAALGIGLAVLLMAGLFIWADMGTEEPGQLAHNAELRPPQPSPADQALETNADESDVAFIRNMEPETYRGTDLIGRAVHNLNDRELGTVSDVILGLRGEVSGVVIDVDGAFGTDEAAVPFAALRFALPEAATGRSATVQEPLDKGEQRVYGDGDLAEPGDLTERDTLAERTTSGDTLSMRVYLPTRSENLDDAPRFDDSLGQ